jgi:thiol-disulfide isomerase/thioredoxin
MRRAGPIGLLLLLLAPIGWSDEALPPGILRLAPAEAPALVAEDGQGNRFDLAQARGQWVFVHFWASWCGPCRREMPSIQALAEESLDLALVLVNTAEDEDTLFFFLAEVAPELHSYRDPNGLVTEAWQPRGLPATYLVDPEGRLRYQALGGRPWDEPPYLAFLRALTEVSGSAD